jgi:cytochrome c553
MPRSWERVPTLVAGAGLAVLVLAVGATLFVLSGLYNVSANKKHFDITTWLLDVIRRQSVWSHTLGLTAPALDDPDMIRLGAGHFVRGCALCHGSPATSRSPLASSMLPEPPALDAAALAWSAEQLFWIVREGQKYTGMPHWIAPEREDEVWAITAFLKQLPGLDAAAYEELATAGIGVDPARSELDFDYGGDNMVLANCVRCHGKADETPPSALVPRLGGQWPGYLERALREYAMGRRQSGVMQMAAAGLDDEAIRELAAYYAAGAAPPIAASEPDPEQIARGALIFSAGVPEGDIPACVSCHSGLPGSRFPRVAGLSARYVEQQLHVWQQGLRRETGFGAIMSVVAQRLTDNQIADVAAYLQSLPPPGPAVDGGGGEP